MRLFTAVLVVAIWLPLPCVGAPRSSSTDFTSFAFQPHPGRQLPLAAILVGETGRSVTLGHFFSGKPVVLVLEYLRCRSLCGLTLEKIIDGLEALPPDGRNFQMLAISIDPRDTPTDLARAKSKYLAPYPHRGDAGSIHFLAGKVSSVRQIADAIGFPYRYDGALDGFIHPAGFILASPDGRISRYIFGVGAEAASLRTGLVDAAQGEALSPLTRLFLLCHIEGTPLGRYTVPVLMALTIANLGAGAALIIVFGAIRSRRHG